MKKVPPTKNIVENITDCPDCNSPLQKCLIQQNYAIVICTKEDCPYPFNQRDVTGNLVYVYDSDIISVAKQRLSRK